MKNRLTRNKTNKSPLISENAQLQQQWKIIIIWNSGRWEWDDWLGRYASGIRGWMRSRQLSLETEIKKKIIIKMVIFFPKAVFVRSGEEAGDMSDKLWQTHSTTEISSWRRKEALFDFKARKIIARFVIFVLLIIQKLIFLTDKSTWMGFSL